MKKWEAKSYERTNVCYVIDEDGKHIFEETTAATDTISKRAKLIAAAPSLLFTLEKLLNVCELNMDDLEPDTVRVINKARKSIEELK